MRERKQNTDEPIKLYLQKIVEGYKDSLPEIWLGVDFTTFSGQKSLFDYQQEALQNALKALYLFYGIDKGDKSKFYMRYKRHGLTDDLSYSGEKALKYLRKNNYPIEDEKVSFEHFINRMSFWMATGSGKTLVIVKLLELLGYLMQKELIPKKGKDILFLTYREDLIEQFKRHVDEFNSARKSLYQINLITLKNYAESKQYSTSPYNQVLNVYYYRSDLISDKSKDKIVDYEQYDNNGNWYIILDEAHKGDKEESKRQIFYSILSRNGFMFNFSATFTDKRDYATCVYNFNLARFIEEGYGKHIYISKQNIKALESKETVLDTEKQKILLKILVLQTAISKVYDKIKKKNLNSLYHKPLLLVLVNSVNTEDSDLELFFREIGKVASGQIDHNILEEAKGELLFELTSDDFKLEFENTKLKQHLNLEEIIKAITYNDILECVFNSGSGGTIEVLKIPSNKQELIFKLKTSPKPFALMKIGDITEWIKTKLEGYEVSETFDNESYFKNINNNEDITILMGSRSFYEGWDSNRPNIILFINIGKGTDAKKFVLQSIGRGVRIEPLPNKKGRLSRLLDKQEVSEDTFGEIESLVNPLETLFVFGTKADNLKEVVETLKQEKSEISIGDLFEINPDVKDKELLIPVYSVSDKIIVEDQDIIKYPIHPDDYQMVKAYYNYIGEKVALVKYDCDVRVLKKIKEGFNGKEEDYFIWAEDRKIGNPEFLLQSIFKHFSNKTKEFKTFKKLEEEIIHFKRVSITADKLNSLKDKIEKVKKAKDKEMEISLIDKEFDEGKISREEYRKRIREIERDAVEEAEVVYSPNEKLKIKYLANHYYLPIVLTEAEKADFIKHIIKHKSEADFINELGDYLTQSKNFFTEFDWWFFSKIDETVDNVYIPYYNPKTNRIDKYNPDFIFWLKKGNEYIILFIDPKGTEHTEAYRKIDGFKRMFEGKEFLYGETVVKVKLLFKTDDISRVPKEYRNYWFDHISEIGERLGIRKAFNLSSGEFEQPPAKS